MGAKDYWERMLVYFGIADEPEEYDVRDERPARGRRTAVADPDDDWGDDEPAPEPRRRRGRGASAAGVGIVPPRTFNDAQSIADKFKHGTPVIVNLQQTDPELSKRLIDFASGLTYGLDGSMSRIADKVFLLTPANVQVSAEEKAAMLESGFFNQS